MSPVLAIHTGGSLIYSALEGWFHHRRTGTHATGWSRDYQALQGQYLHAVDHRSLLWYPHTFACWLELITVHTPTLPGPDSPSTRTYNFTMSFFSRGNQQPPPKQSGSYNRLPDNQGGGQRQPPLPSQFWSQQQQGYNQGSSYEKRGYDQAPPRGGGGK